MTYIIDPTCVELKIHILFIANKKFPGACLSCFFENHTNALILWNIYKDKTISVQTETTYCYEKHTEYCCGLCRAFCLL